MSSFKDLPWRSWSQLSERWIEHFPADFEPYEHNTIEALVRSAGVSPADKLIVDRVPQLRETALYLSCLLRRKAAYCFEAAATMNEQGYPTGASIIMYDASFYAAKGLIYLLGIVDAARDSKFYIELFYLEKNRKRGVLDDVGHQFFHLGDRLTHQILWGLVERCLNTLKVDEELEEPLRQIKNNKFEEFSKERNKMIYVAQHWSRIDDINESDLDIRISYFSNIKFFRDIKSGESEYYEPYNKGAIALMSFYDALFKALAGQSSATKTVYESIQRVPLVDSYRFI